MTDRNDRPTRILALAQVTSSLGDGAYLVCSALYFTLVVGLSLAQVGLGLTLGWGVGSVAGVALGHLADRKGPRGVAVLLAVATAVAVGSFLFVSSFAMFVVMACVYASCQSGLAAARQALLAGLVGKTERAGIRAYLQSKTNAGLAIGAALGGLALHFGTREAYLIVFAVDAASIATAAVVLSRLPVVAPVAARRGERSLAVLRDRPYALLSLLNMFMLLYMPLFTFVIPLWIVRRTDAPAWTVSAMLVFNMLSVVLFQVRVARRIVGLAGAARFSRYAGLAMFGACAVFALSATGASAWVSVLILLAGASLQVLGEMMQAAGGWQISFTLAPAGKQGQYQGFFGAGAPVARMLGPLLLSTVVLSWGFGGWLLLGALFAVAGCATAPAVRWAERRQSVAHAPIVNRAKASSLEA